MITKETIGGEEVFAIDSGSSRFECDTCCFDKIYLTCKEITCKEIPCRPTERDDGRTVHFVRTDNLRTQAAFAIQEAGK